MKQTITIDTAAEVKIFHLAVCVTCDHGHNPLPMPFDARSERTNWVLEHFAATGHDIRELTEIQVTVPQ